MPDQSIAERLREPFPPEAIGWKPQSVTSDGTRAMAVAYIDARDVMNRLDDVVGPDGWSDAYRVLEHGQVVCCLSVRLGKEGDRFEWVDKEDVGAMSEQSDEGDRLKAAFSDALKRAAVKFGIGRYLYSLPITWHDYDKAKRQFRTTPQLPAWALPKTKTATPSAYDDKMVESCKEFLQELPPLARFNSYFQDARKMKDGPGREAIKKMLLAYAKDCYWEYDSKTDAFKKSADSPVHPRADKS